MEGPHALVVTIVVLVVGSGLIFVFAVIFVVFLVTLVVALPFVFVVGGFVLVGAVCIVVLFGSCCLTHPPGGSNLRQR